ncbi:glycosyltransferase [Sulfitobacter sp. SK011]|uniref:glycosyltransferase n=1 Tax=Sulfitobacter sp. SK011 TaxID=1389004 RepID=UPI0013B41FD5|nr:glycosyltransferase [Sulfitobacter sp. SK011]
MTLALRDKEFTDSEAVTLSICSITFNHSLFIEECLEGFLDQICDFRVEIVIHDDASTDDTASILRKYAKLYPTIFRLILQTENQFSKGVNPYYAYVMPAARGDYIAFCDGDDFWSDPEKLARQVAILEAEPDIALTYGRVRAITETGVISQYRAGAEHDLTPSDLKNAPSINTLTACFRNVFRDGSPSLFVSTSTIGDLTVWGILGYHGGGRFLPDMPPANYRIHANGLLSMQSRERKLLLTAITHFHMAAFHDENSDRAAFRASIKSMLRFYNELGVLPLAEAKLTDMPFKTVMKNWRRAIKRYLKNR